jgi:hypothetical protein
MIESGRRSASLYISIVLYALFVFFTQWSLSSARIDEIWIHDILTSVMNFILLPSILILTVYSICINFEYYAKHKWFTMLFIILLLFVAFITESISFTLPLLIGFAGFYANNRTTAKFAVVSFSILLITSLIFSVAGLNGGDTVSKPLFGVDDSYAATVTALGLSNPNSVMLIFFNVIALTLFLCNTKRQSFLSSVLLFALTVIFSVATGSTTGLIMGIVTLVLVLSAKYHKNLLKLFRKITPWMFLLITFLTFAVALNFGLSGDRQNDVNTTLTGRPYLWNLRIENGSYINLLGGNDQYVGDTNYPLDNAPLYILVYFGAVMYLIFFYIFYSGSKKIKEPELIAYILAATLLLFSEKPELYGLVLIFLQKTITEHHFLYNKKVKI